MWERWRNSGALGTVDDARTGRFDGLKSCGEPGNAQIVEEFLASARTLGPQIVIALGEHFAGPAAGKTTVSWGERIISDTLGWRVTEHIIAYVVDGHNHSGDLHRPVAIPKKAKPLSRYFQNR